VKKPALPQGKIPIPKNQIPGKAKNPNIPKLECCSGVLDFLNLGFTWDLGSGIWILRFGAR
jgi:hypothetical protein